MITPGPPSLEHTTRYTEETARDIPDGGKKEKHKKGSEDNKSKPGDVGSKLLSAMNSPKGMKKLTARIWDSTLTKLRIKLNPNTINKALSLKPQKMETYCVKKMTKESRNLRKTFVVARRITDDMDSKLWIPSGHDGMKLGDQGEVISYSILGSVQDYMNEAKLHGHLVPIPRPVTSDTRPPNPPRVSHKKTSIKYTSTRHVKQDHALSFWKEEQQKRQNLGKFIANITKQSPHDLSMSDHPYEQIRAGTNPVSNQYEAAEFDRSKTTFTGFWRQQEQLGDERKGIHLSLTKTEMGFIRDEEILCKAVPGRPLIAGTERAHLRIDGQKLRKPGYKDAMPCTHVKTSCGKIPVQSPAIQIQGPALYIGGEMVKWSDDNNEVNVELGVNVCPGEARMGNLPVKNIGSCVIHYKLVKTPKEDKFNLANHCADKLYIDASCGMILPEETKNISVIFSSKKAGVFSEKWKIVTTPNLGKDGINVNVWGIAKEKNEMGDNCKEIMRKLELKIKRNFMTGILMEIIERVCCEQSSTKRKLTEYPSEVEHWFSPSYVANDLFSCVNQGLVYHSGFVSNVMEVVTVAMPEIEIDRWTLPLGQIRASMLKMADPVIFRNELIPANNVFDLFMSYVGELSYGVQTSVSTIKTDICKKLLQDVLNNVCDTASRIKKIYGITLDMDFQIEVQKEEHVAAKVIKTPPKSPSRDAKHRKRHSAHKHPPDATPPSPTGQQKLGRIIKGIHKAKKSQYENRAKPIMYRKYLETLNINTYIEIREMLDKLTLYLSDL